jgi:hypothetical protein
MSMILMALALAAQTVPAAPAPRADPAPPTDAAQPSARAAWSPIAEDPWGHYFLDPASVRRDGDVVRFNLRAVANQDLGNGTAYFIAGHAFDCARRTFTILSAYSYRADGSFIGSRVSRPDELAGLTRPIEAGSSQERMLQTVCAIRR